VLSKEGLVFGADGEIEGDFRSVMYMYSLSILVAVNPSFIPTSDCGCDVLSTTSISYQP